MHPIVGIDIGKDELWLGFIPAGKAKPRDWKSVVKVSYADPRWWLTLLDLIADEAVVAAEPTGHHLLAPIANLLFAYKPNVALWQVDGKQTQRYRESYVSDAKNDRLDAIALTLIARDIAAGTPPLHSQPYNFFLQSDVQRLRMLVNQHRRLTKELTRTSNQLDILAHSLWPAFAGSPTWLRAVANGAVTPAQVKALAAADPPIGDYHDGRARRFLVGLAATLPDIETDPTVAAGILDLVQHQRLTDDQRTTVAANIRSAIDAAAFAQVTRRWHTMPGSSDLAIAALHVATYGRAREFSVDAFCAALGTSPKTAISGDKDVTKATRKGYRPVRATLHMWTLALLSPSAAPNPIRDYYQASDHHFLPSCRNKLARTLWGIAFNDQDFEYRPRRDATPRPPRDEAGEYPPAK